MQNYHEKLTIRVYKDHGQASASQHIKLFHAYNLCRYFGMLNSLFTAVGKAKVLARDIQENEAFKCAVCASKGISETFNNHKKQDPSPVSFELLNSTKTLIQSVQKAQNNADMSKVLILLNLASIVLYEQLRNCLLDDVCVYREITPDAALCEFAANLTPSVDLRDTELASQQLVKILDAMKAG